MGEHVQRHANAFVLLDVKVLELRPLQYPGAISDKYCGGLAKQQNPVRRGLVKGDALRLVVDKFRHELEQGRRHLWIVPPNVQGPGEQRYPGGGRVLGVVDEPVEEHLIRLATRAGQADATQVPAEADEGTLAALLSQQRGVLAALLPERVQDVPLWLHELFKSILVLPNVHEQELPQSVVIHGSVLPVRETMGQEPELG
mmetsp:Transcript_29324/g.74389  ORF Transcript_29324/g.74389 Transcript_29324/m.74389 type:complete len:200 (-) Transcript_29324:611-1210(-)